MERHQEGGQVFECQTSNKSYKTSEALDQHQKKDQANGKYVIIYCLRWILLTEIPIVLAGTRDPYVCEMCGKTFRFAVRLKDHQSVHTGN